MALNETEISCFKDQHIKLRNTLTQDEINYFATLKTNSERILYLYKFEVVQKYPKITCTNNKNIDIVNKLKESGNLTFKKEAYSQALYLYSQSILKCPETEDTILSIIYANRSACLYHLQEYQIAIRDIEHAFALNYPKEISYKLYDRKARCLLALKQYNNATEIFKHAITALDDAKLSKSARQKWQKDIQIMIAMMTTQKNIGNAKVEVRKTIEKLYKNRNKVYTSASSTIEIKYSDAMGRYAEAVCQIPVGEVILMEEAHCAVLLQEYQYTHCFHCLKRVIALEACLFCDQVIFCSRECRNIAMTTHHKKECKILNAIWSSGISITCHMALRIITQKSVEYFLEMKPKLNNYSPAFIDSEDHKHDSADYRNIYNLVTHEEKRKTEDLLQRIHLTIFLLKCLRFSNYFDIKGKVTDATQLSEDELYIGELIFHNVQLLQFNAHEISELHVINNDFENGRSVFIGGAIYPTLALFNHSCNPTLVRYFNGTQVVARTVRNINVGDMVAENYGPIFTQNPKEERQNTLKEQYWFDCQCKACIEEWPLLDSISKTKELRFKCTGVKCQSVIPVPYDTMEFITKCNKCGTLVNILKGLKMLQDTDGTFSKAKSLLRNQQIAKSLNQLLNILKIYDTILVPPFQDYHLCQQAIRNCFLTYGNVYKLNR